MTPRRRLVFAALAAALLPACGPDGYGEVTFIVHPPATGTTSAIYLSGDVAELGAWEAAGGPMLAKQDDGTYRGTVKLPVGDVEFKVTQGTWRTVERGAQEEDIPNRTLTVDEDGDTVELHVASWLPAAKALTGDIRYHDLAWTAKGFNRRVIVYLPLGYEDNPDRSYPVLYMHDGQNLMDASTSFAGEWNADETAQRLIRNGQIEPIIIVGVYNGGNLRIAEYTYVADPEYGGGDAEAYRVFLRDAVKPFIDGTYRTRPEAQYTGIAGSSLGGLVSVWLGLVESATFTRVGAVSTSVWWADRDIIGRVNGLGAKLPLTIWEDMGATEGATGLTDARDLRDAFLAKGWVLEDDLRYKEYQYGGHSESSWSARFHEILIWLYPPVP